MDAQTTRAVASLIVLGLTGVIIFAELGCAIWVAVLKRRNASLKQRLKQQRQRRAAENASRS